MNYKFYYSRKNSKQNYLKCGYGSNTKTGSGLKKSQIWIIARRLKAGSCHDLPASLRAPLASS